MVKLLRIHQESHDFLFFHVKNDVGLRRGHFFYDLKPLGVLPGVSDFCIVKPGKVAFLEIKRKQGKLSDSQKSFLNAIQNFGHEGYVAYGWDDILEKVNKIIN